MSPSTPFPLTNVTVIGLELQVVIVNPYCNTMRYWDFRRLPGSESLKKRSAEKLQCSSRYGLPDEIQFASKGRTS